MNVNTKEVQRDFARAASTYDAGAALQREVLAHAAGLLAPFLSENTLLLDAGCGTGMSRDVIPHGGIIGIDIAAPMCAIARRRGVHAASADIRRLPLADACVDAALCSLVLQWVPGRTAALAELLRVLRPQGHLLLAAFGEQTLHELRAVLPARVHAFPSLAVLASEAQSAGWARAAEDSRCYVKHYDSLAALLRPLKSIGAVNKLPARARGLTTAATFQRAEALYRKQHGGIRATWEVHFLLLQKP